MASGAWANVWHPMRQRRSCNPSFRNPGLEARQAARGVISFVHRLQCHSWTRDMGMPAPSSSRRKANVSLCADRSAPQMLVSAHHRIAIVKIRLGSSRRSLWTVVDLVGLVPHQSCRIAQRSLVFARQRLVSARTLPTRRSRATRQRPRCGRVGLADHKRVLEPMASVVGWLLHCWQCFLSVSAEG